MNIEQKELSIFDALADGIILFNAHKGNLYGHLDLTQFPSELLDLIISVEYSSDSDTTIRNIFTEVAEAAREFEDNCEPGYAVSADTIDEYKDNLFNLREILLSLISESC